MILCDLCGENPFGSSPGPVRPSGWDDCGHLSGRHICGNLHSGFSPRGSVHDAEYAATPEVGAKVSKYGRPSERNAHGG